MASSCGTTPSARFMATPAWRASCPATRISPFVGARMPESIPMVVVLPAPFGPSSPKISPRRISSVIPSTAGVVSYVFHTSFICAIGSAALIVCFSTLLLSVVGEPNGGQERLFLTAKSDRMRIIAPRYDSFREFLRRGLNSFRLSCIIPDEALLYRPFFRGGRSIAQTLQRILRNEGGVPPVGRPGGDAEKIPTRSRNQGDQ